ncbi:energy transducer TonB [Halomonas sp. GFAJ-1]|uniref:energy transducer TonB n=1 Tax=Halomonas sp. GFAJ-1 TaxID=1118153 RepID=UPI00023A16AC|nr:energy transducer TonB [Halomonas sp. GFAJ-1]AVI63181.1 iron transporter [Halomonas sp. GFAJ-1]EHK60630.1 TonB-like protein [Halomonas sp. GFAJ-1]
MIRHVLSLSGGVALAVGLFWLLALLVTPPERALEKPEMTLSMNMVEAPEVAPEQETPPPQPADAAPAAAPPPMAMPEPPPMAESAITMPEVELPEEPVEPLELDSELPELTEVTPEPTPPTPQPEPAPQAQPEPSPIPSTAQREAAPQAEPAPSSEPVSVGQVAPTNRVNPTYPPRAQRRGMEGFVEVAFVIRRDGSVDSSTIQVTNAQPRRVFEDAAREAIARWQFEPSQQLRRATQRIEFQLR